MSDFASWGDGRSATGASSHSLCRPGAPFARHVKARSTGRRRFSIVIPSTKVHETLDRKLLAVVTDRLTRIAPEGTGPVSSRLPTAGTGSTFRGSGPTAVHLPRVLGAVLVTSLVLTGTLAAGQLHAQAVPVLRSPRGLLVTRARPASSSRHDLAQRDAAYLLTLVRLPTGSARVTEEPSGDSHLLGTAAQSIGDPNLVDLHCFFVAPQNAWTSYRFERSHPPSGSASSGGYNGYGTASTYGNTDAWFVSYSWPPVEALLDSRVLVISIAALPDRTSAIRVDAQVTWLPAKPAGDTVPEGAKVLTAVLSSGLNPGETGHLPVTTTDPEKIAAIRNFVNKLSVVAPAVRFCPADFGQHLTISFRENARTRPLAVVVADVSGCRGSPGRAWRARGYTGAVRVRPCAVGRTRTRFSLRWHRWPAPINQSESRTRHGFSCGQGRRTCSRALFKEPSNDTPATTRLTQ